MDSEIKQSRQQKITTVMLGRVLITRVARIGARLMSACPPTAAQKRSFNHFGLVQIVLQKSFCTVDRKFFEL
jgi:hypothetical protein